MRPAGMLEWGTRSGERSLNSTHSMQRCTDAHLTFCKCSVTPDQAWSAASTHESSFIWCDPHCPSPNPPARPLLTSLCRLHRFENRCWLFALLMVMIIRPWAFSFSSPLHAFVCLGWAGGGSSPTCLFLVLSICDYHASFWSTRVVSSVCNSLICSRIG